MPDALFVGSFLLLMAIGVPIAFAMLLPSVAWLALSGEVNLGLALARVVAPIDSFVLTAVPLFIFMGTLAEAAGLADRLYDFVAASLRRVRGSLAYVNVLASFGFSWMSGSAVADAGSMARVEVPAMVKRGYDPSYAVGLTAASSLLSPVMPPSIPAVLYASTASVSLGAMLLAGIGPALAMLVVLMVWVAWTTRRRTAEQDLLEAIPWTTSLRRAFMVFPLPIILLGGILFGTFTPTEAAAVSVGYVIAVGSLGRLLDFERLRRAALAASMTSAQILFMVACASLFSWILAYEQLPARMADFLLELTSYDAVAFMAISLIMLLLIGMVLDPASAIIIMVPVLLPPAIEVGIDPVHFGMVMILDLMIGLLHPPVGLVLYVLTAATGLPLGVVVRGVLPHLVLFGVALLLVAFVPPISTTIPSLMSR